MKKTARILISLPESWVQAFREAATAESKSLSEWLRDAGAKRLSRDVRRALPRPAKPGPKPS